jgi:hypothetical protein
MIEKIEGAAEVENCDVQDGQGGKVLAHRIVATTAEGLREMTVFIGGESADRAAQYARARYTDFRGFRMHCDPFKAGVVGAGQSQPNGG